MGSKKRRKEVKPNNIQRDAASADQECPSSCGAGRAAALRSSRGGDGALRAASVRLARFLLHPPNFSGVRLGPIPR